MLKQISGVFSGTNDKDGFSYTQRRSAADNLRRYKADIATNHNADGEYGEALKELHNVIKALEQKEPTIQDLQTIETGSSLVLVALPISPKFSETARALSCNMKKLAGERLETYHNIPSLASSDKANSVFSVFISRDIHNLKREIKRYSSDLKVQEFGYIFNKMLDGISKIKLRELPTNDELDAMQLTEKTFEDIVSKNGYGEEWKEDKPELYEAICEIHNHTYLDGIAKLAQYLNVGKELRTSNNLDKTYVPD